MMSGHLQRQRPWVVATLWVAVDTCLPALLNARISLWTTTRFHRHLPQTHLLAMSLTKIQPPLPLQKKNTHLSKTA